MRFNRFPDGSMSDRFDDAGFIVWPREQRLSGSRHLAVIGRGLIVLALLALPILLTLMGIAPPNDSEPEMVFHPIVMQPVTVSEPLTQVITQRLRIQG